MGNGSPLTPPQVQPALLPPEKSDLLDGMAPVDESSPTPIRNILFVAACALTATLLLIFFAVGPRTIYTFTSVSGTISGTQVFISLPA
jgi:hypothetical protein